MHYLVVANLFLSALLIAAAIGAGLFFYLKRRRRKRADLLPGDPSRDYAAANTKRRPAGSLNYSSFVYLDVDRDGRYGVGDRPMAGVKVRLSGDGSHLLASRTNGNGFANFATWAGSHKAPIQAPGGYEFAVSVPPEWVCTSKNEIQAMPFDLIKGSPAGIGAAEMVKPVGLAPIRFVRGETSDEPVTLVFTNQGETLLKESLKPDSPFKVCVPDGADTVEVDGPGLDRSLTLSTYPAHIGVLTSQRQAIGSDARLEAIDFNEVTPRGLRKIPSGYAGLNWFNLNAISRDFHGGSEGYVNGTTSGDHACYTSSGHPAEFWSDRPFGFHSVMISAAWLRSEGEIAKIESWQGNKLIATDVVAVSALGPIQYAPMLNAVTRVRLSSNRYWQLVLDDLIVAR